MTFLDVLAVVLGGGLGGFVSGVSGFAFGMVAMAAWIWRFDPWLVAPMVVFGSVVTQSTSLACLHCRVKWRLIRPFLIGGVLGVPLGVHLLGRLDVTLFKGVVGVMILLFSVVLLFVPPRSPMRPGNRAASGAVGFVGGAMGGLCGLNGPPLIAWCLVNGWDKDTQRGLTQTFFLVTQGLTLLAYVAAGRITPRVLLACGVMTPAVLAASYAGSRIAERIDAVSFRRIVLALLLLSGLVLLAGSLTDLLRR